MPSRMRMNGQLEFEQANVSIEAYVFQFLSYPVRRISRETYLLQIENSKTVEKRRMKFARASEVRASLRRSLQVRRVKTEESFIALYWKF